MRPRNSTNGNPPDWDTLFEIAQAQLGYFSTKQAAAAGYSSQLLYKYLNSRTVNRVRRGIYRLVHFPVSQEEDLVPLWLWTDQVGVFSHETALALHDLSDGLPSRVHMTVPADWRRRRLRMPEGLVLHFADIDDGERASSAAVPMTSPLRTLRDCIDKHVAPDLVNQAVLEAVGRGLISRDEQAELVAALDQEADHS